MNDSIFSGRNTLVWFALIAITLLSWKAGHSCGSASTAGVIILLFAFAKARLIISEFMEVRTAPRALQWLTDGWIIIACGLLVTLSLGVFQPT
jgi:Prokaryotic Cytochrome C oxidase subunit IV